ncbi:unnamed protein product [marine sediment metagenome]|uniref:Uncharacterized protein n=1 Tax=marine sediment metagenome TaxID=412755 RepID=X1JIS6_9ZZZZ
MIETLQANNHKVMLLEHQGEGEETSGQQPEGRWFESNPR